MNNLETHTQLMTRLRHFKWREKVKNVKLGKASSKKLYENRYVCLTQSILCAFCYLCGRLSLMISTFFQSDFPAISAAECFQDSFLILFCVGATTQDWLLFRSYFSYSLLVYFSTCHVWVCLFYFPPCCRSLFVEQLFIKKLNGSIYASLRKCVPRNKESIVLGLRNGSGDLRIFHNSWK